MMKTLSFAVASLLSAWQTHAGSIDNSALAVGTTTRRLVTDGDIKVNSKAGQRLLSQARRLDDGSGYFFLTDYSIKFQGCHHVQQWNENVDGDSDVRIMTKRLVRFRLCPSDSCSNEKSTGCSYKFGDYIVDMDTFLDAYLTNMEEDKDNMCQEVASDCNGQCNNDSTCLANCYAGYSLSWCLDDGNDNNNFDVSEYAYCNQWKGNRRQLANADDNNNNNGYYLGAFCADQGGEIHLGMFTDDTCTTFAQNGYNKFYNTMGFEMPYKSTSLVTSRCVSCINSDDNGNVEAKELCENIYSMSGKCETRMSIEYPNESSCNYIEGIKIIREDGVIRTSTTRKSKSAAVAIGLFTTMSVLLAGYVYYLRTKLSRAQINLAAASQPLTYV